MIATLLAAALQLLISAQQPNIPDSLRIQAINTANIAIEFAHEYASTTVQETAPVQNNPIYGNTQVQVTPVKIETVPTPHIPECINRSSDDTCLSWD